MDFQAILVTQAIQVSAVTQGILDHQASLDIVDIQVHQVFLVILGILVSVALAVIPVILE